MPPDATGAEKVEENAQWGNLAADRLRSLIERIERLEEERKALGSDIKDIYAEAKSAGFDVKVESAEFASMLAAEAKGDFEASAEQKSALAKSHPGH